jgi:hypothetical protein
LSHTIIPHHHHQTQIFLVGPHSLEKNTEHTHKTHGHEHDGNSESHHCLLKQVIVIPPNQLRQTFDANNLDSNFDFTNLFVAVLYKNPIERKELLNLYKARRHTEFSSHYINYVNLSTGLRAPPIV